jgi:colicin import membrane protein
MEYFRKHKNGLIGTFAFHAIVFVLLFFLEFFTPLPLPEEEGILVNFGDSETGFGELEPSPAINEAEPPPRRNEEEVPEVVAPAVKVKTPPKPSPEEIMTQNYEKTAAIEAARKKKEEDRKKQAELEILRKAEQERLRQEAEARKKQEDENRKIAEINSRTKGAFGNTSGGSGGTGTGTGQNQGVNFPGGNQGNPTGDPNAGNYGPGGGTGTSGNGISYNISGRTATSTPKPNYPGREDGIVVVKITVDRNGRVTAAEPGQRGTTTMNPDLHDAAKRAAMQAKFNVDENAPAFQTGTITYRFIIQSQ